MTPTRKTAFLLITALIMALIVGCSNTGNSATSTVNAGAHSSDLPAMTTGEPESPDSEEASESAASANTDTGDDTSSISVGSSDYPVSMGKVTALRLADFKTGWAGGEGWISRTNDGGKTWKLQLQHKYIVKQLFALNDREVWATLGAADATTTFKLVHTMDGGKSWAEIGEVPNPGFLHFGTSKEGFVGNARTEDGGKTWSTLPVPTGLVGEAYFHDLGNGWAVTQNVDKQELYINHTADAGKTWDTVLTRKSAVPVTGTVIRSAGKNDAWVQLIGDSGMSQTSYSLFHTVDGGKSWIPVLANHQAGSGPAPGYENSNETGVPRNNGSGPGTLYVVDSQTAFMGGRCSACDLPNTMGKTVDYGKTWTNLPAEFPGYGEQLIAAADADHVWWINTDNVEPSVMYVSSDGGKNWTKVHAFDKPKAQ
ncbi:WD40/YVTN/BNR-like repeat-containing protein [Cohnella lupini]|uniref:BNR/Asp-box repeat protein n=1 Tax=Cohnella lupini TaxID=1294267 RepID=A0A3D9IT27_9BACL|nr:hypothetical protein [Cohnella lupini]RED64920.1 BNR/Asp-box repeat protein [Cohnella lupini]